MATRADINHPLDEFHVISEVFHNTVRRQLAGLHADAERWLEDFQEKLNLMARSHGIS